MKEPGGRKVKRETWLFDLMTGEWCSLESWRRVCNARETCKRGKRRKDREKEVCCFSRRRARRPKSTSLAPHKLLPIQPILAPSYGTDRATRDLFRFYLILLNVDNNSSSLMKQKSGSHLIPSINNCISIYKMKETFLTWKVGLDE